MCASHAHIFFWIELCIATGVSVVGNAAQAVMHGLECTLMAGSGPDTSLK